jgi:hypothetical protein
MKTKGIWLALSLLVVGLLLVALASNSGQRALQRMKYGDPVSFCIGDVGVTLKQDWQIALLKHPNSEWPLVAGLFRAPVSFKKEGSSVAQVSLKSAKHDGEVSIHWTQHAGAREEVLSNCNANQFCKPAVSRFDAGSEVVAVAASGTTWIKYLDKPIMIGVHGVAAKDVEGIAVGACDGK